MLVRAGLGRGAAGATATMVVASNLPDADIVTAFGGSVAYLAAHRGLTHGPIGIVLFAAVSALAIAAVRAARQREPAVWRGVPVLFGVALTGTVLHVLMDLPTSYGTRALAPFDNTWYALDWLPIIDVYVWALLVLGLVIGRVRPERQRMGARVALGAIVAFYALRAVSHGEALAIAAGTRADGTPAACASAAVLTRHPTVIEARDAGPGACLQAAALPTFFSPFRWRLLRQQTDRYELREVVLGRDEPITPRVLIHSDSDAWSAAARRADTARVFLNFSRFPAFRSEVLPDGTHRVRIVDVRFIGPPPRALGPDPQARAPFVVTVELSATGSVNAERLGT